MQPLLARFVAHVREHRDATARLLAAAGACRQGETFECDGATFRRQRHRISAAEQRAGTTEPVTVRRIDGPSRKLLNCRLLEDRAFWAWAVTEILRLTGLRCEELIELTHVSIRRHRMADDREILLLQIAPSKQDRERVIPVCPELAHALARVVERTRGRAPRIPCIPRYDPCERATGAPLPYLFQGGPKRQRGVFCRESIRRRFCQVSCQQVSPVGCGQDDLRLRGLQDAQHRHAAAQEPQAALEGGDVLVAAGTRAEEVAQFVVASTEPGR